jgi:phosphate transport system substrate-binding protein
MHMNRTTTLAGMGLALGLVGAVTSTAIADGDLLINGAGATFPAPLYSKWFSDYNKLHPDLKFNYQSIGSGGGIKQITEHTVDFGASDAPLSDEQLAKTPGLLHIPTVMGAVVVTYNLPAVTSLRLTPETVAGIFLGKITRWNDPALAQINPGTALPDAAITVIHRSDGSGTSAIFTDYLSKVSPEWQSRVGHATSVKWPVGLGGKGNEGVTGQVKQTPGALGYVELAYAHQNKLPAAALKNKDGSFIEPSIASTSAAAAGVEIPDDFRVSITNGSGPRAYPIASFTYILIYKEQQDTRKGPALAHFLWWASHEGQKAAPALDYAPLPSPVVKKVEVKLQALTVDGKPVLATSK